MFLSAPLEAFLSFPAEYPQIAAWYTTIVRFLFPLLAIAILAGAIRSMWRVKHLPEVWA